MTYTVGGLIDSNVEPATTGGSTMIVYLSFPNMSSKYRHIIETLEERGLSVVTNFDESDPDIVLLPPDIRLSWIQKCDAYVYFSTEQHPSGREIEFGYAIGLGLPVAYVGKVETILHRFGDVFVDTDHFLSWWYSGDYLRLVSAVPQLQERATAVA